MHRWGAAGRRGSAVAVMVGVLVGGALAGCSKSGTVTPFGGSSSGKASSGGPVPTNQSGASGHSGTLNASSSSTSSATSAPDTTVSKDEAAAALKTYQGQNNTANAALDNVAMAKIEGGSLSAVDQASLLYAQGAGGDKAAQAKTPLAFNDPVLYPVRTTLYPREFFVTANGVQAGLPNNADLLHFTQDHPGAPWVVDFLVALAPGQQWPAFAVAPDGALDYLSTRLDKVALSTTDLVAADRATISDDNAGQPGSSFLNDDATTAEQRWIHGENDDVAPAEVSMTVSSELKPAPTYVPLKNGGELVLYATRISLRVSQSGRSFTLDPGWAKVAGNATFSGGFTADSVWMTAAVDPPDKGAKIQKIAYNGGLVAVR